MARQAPILSAVVSSLFSTALLLLLVVPISALFGPTFLVLTRMPDSVSGTTTRLTLAAFGTIAQCLVLHRAIAKPLYDTSRPGSRYARRWMSSVALTYCQIILSLLRAGPLRIAFVGRDPFGISSGIRREIRDIDARVLGVRPPIHRVREGGRDITIPLRDGVETAATIYSPLREDGGDDENDDDDATPRPVVLIRTPYNRASLARWGARFAERGYHLVAQDTRGRFGSTGEFFPMLNEAADGAATIEWLEEQPWCDGRVGMTGVSYLGLASWAAMREGVPALKAVAPILAATDLYNVMFGRESGAAHVELLFRWSHLVIHLMNKPFGMLEAMFTFFMGTGRALRDAYRHAPLGEADTKYLCPDSEPLEWFQDGFAHPLGTEPFWDGKRKFVDFDKMDTLPPVLLFGGWYDFFCSEQLHDFRAVSRLNPDCRLVVGPYTHWHIMAMQPKLFRTLFDFFDKHLLKDPAAKTLPPVDVFCMGHDMGWRQMPSWPPPNCLTKKFALVQDEDGDNLIVEIDGDGNDVDTGTIEQSEVSYIYDPADPTPQIGGATFNPSNCGRLAQNQIEDRDDMLVFTSRPLDKPLTIAGEINVRLTVESSVEGTDYVARACHVTPDGASQNIADGIVRRFDLKPGERTEIQIGLSPVMNRLAAGDRLRVHICSSAYPKYGRHLNTRESFHLEVEGNALLSEQDIILGEEGCHVLVPILP